MTEMYSQMTLKRTRSKSTDTRVIWGPSEKAVVGNEVKVEEDDGTWTEGWVVEHVHSTVSKKAANAMSQLYKKQRKASDI